MREPIIRTMWLSEHELACFERGDNALVIADKLRDDYAAHHPVLVIHAPDSEAVVRWERAPGLTLVEPTKPTPAQDDDPFSLARTLAEFRDGEVGATAVVAALDDYISRALERER